jgi:hypothetical protein
MARAVRVVAMTTKRAMASVKTGAMVMVTRVEGNKEGNGKEKGKCGKGNGDGNEGGGQAMVTTWAMVTATRWLATKRAITRAARAIVTAIMMAGKKEAMARGARAMAMAIMMTGDKEGNGDGNNNGG